MPGSLVWGVFQTHFLSPYMGRAGGSGDMSRQQATQEARQALQTSSGSRFSSDTNQLFCSSGKVNWGLLGASEPPASERGPASFSPVCVYWQVDLGPYIKPGLGNLPGSLEDSSTRDPDAWLFSIGDCLHCFVHLSLEPRQTLLREDPPLYLSQHHTALLPESRFLLHGHIKLLRWAEGGPTEEDNKTAGVQTWRQTSGRTGLAYRQFLRVKHGSHKRLFLCLFFLSFISLYFPSTVYVYLI